jgi:2-dehydro-3-deoxyphosphogluconate aldolase/(4S)-4-hydroxy-2-oxoglutarate aldolase
MSAIRADDAGPKGGCSGMSGAVPSGIIGGVSRPILPEAITGPGVVAVARRIPAEAVLAIAAALLAGGIRALELTLDAPEDDALRAIERAAAGDGAEGSSTGAGEGLTIGAGTVRSLEAARRAVDAGASFLVSPHLDARIVAWASGRGIPVLSGAMTPTEVLAGWMAGAAAVKVFPASAVGPGFIRELRGPFPDIPLQPTGGVTVENAADYIRAGAVAVGMGSWLFAGDRDEISPRAAAAVAAVRDGRL